MINSLDQFNINMCAEVLQGEVARCNINMFAKDQIPIDFDLNDDTIDLMKHNTVSIIKQLDQQATQKKTGMAGDKGFYAGLQRLIKFDKKIQGAAKKMDMKDGRGNREFSGGGPYGYDQHTKSVPRDLKDQTAGFFKLQHYAATVTYDVRCWVDKNLDRLTLNSYEALLSTQMKHFMKPVFTPMSTNSEAASVARQFALSLDALVMTLRSTNSNFVRCLKASNPLAKDVWKNALVLNQLKYTDIQFWASQERMKAIQSKGKEGSHASAVLIQSCIRTAVALNSYREANTTLHGAVKHGSKRSVKELLDRGADVNAQDKVSLQARTSGSYSLDTVFQDGKSPLYLAVQLEQFDICAILLEHNAHVDLDSKWTLDEGEPSESEGQKGWPQVLIQMVRSGIHHSALKCLLEANVNPDAQDQVWAPNLHLNVCSLFLLQFRKTPLHYAAAQSCLSVEAEEATTGPNLTVQLLVSHGAKSDLKDAVALTIIACM